MHFLVFGKTGQVARELARLPISATFLSRDLADLDNPEAAADCVRASGADAVIIAAAWTDVNGAEDAEDTAMRVNGAAPGAIALACADKELPMVQISTDYVFDGAGSRAFTPDDPVAPLGAYGRTKLAGEDGVRAAGGTHVILRTSWVFSAHGKNFVKTMLRLSETMSAMNVVADQVGGPTSAKSIAAACVRVAEALVNDPGKSGTYHFSGAPDVSWAEFAMAIFEAAGRSVAVTGIPSADYPTPAKRPLNSRLDCESTSQAFGAIRPDWARDLAEVIEEVSTHI